MAKKRRSVKNWFMLQVWRLQQVSQIVTLVMLTATLSGIIWGYVKYRGGIFGNSVFGILMIALIIGLVVWTFAIFWDTRLKLWRDQMQVLVEKNPYTHEKMSPKELAFKISDYLDGSPDDVQTSLAWYLLCRAHHRRCPPGKADRYIGYARSQELWGPNRSRYLSRARNLVIGPKGEHRDIKEVFDYVNTCYFSGGLQPLVLAWSCESPRQRLGFYFDSLNLLAANRVLDSSRVPRYVLEFVVYHELLHHVDAAGARRIRRVHHTREFREQERAFSHYEDAERWLRRLVSECRRRE